MRLTLALVIAVAIATAVYATARPDDTSAPDVGAVTLVGDSLNVGIEPSLQKELRGWTVDAHDVVGRSTVDGVDELRRLRGSLAPVVVVSLGTNDPEGSDRAFAALVDEAIAIVGPRRCLVWATIVREGVARAAFNRVLERARSAHANVRLVEWAHAVGDDRTLLADDLVHGSTEGYARRAEETADAVRACAR
jgi:lysophospholipase L1-like esterase